MVSILVLASIISVDTASARITSEEQARQKALKMVRGATVTEVERDDEDGIPVYEVELWKGTKEYVLIYKESDGELIEYEWEEQSAAQHSNKKMMSKAECKTLAKKKVKNAKIMSIMHKHDDGADVYKLIMEKGNKRYTLEYHARTKTLLEYKWEILKYI